MTKLINLSLIMSEMLMSLTMAFTEKSMSFEAVCHEKYQDFL